MKILDLFAGSQCVKKAFPNSQYKGVDVIGDNLIIDMTKDNALELLLKKLKGWKPNFIWSSPVCNCFSTALNSKGGGNFYFEIDKNKIPYPRKNWNIKIRKYMEKYLIKYDNSTIAEIRAKNALKMIENTFKIINYFNCPYAIENPAHNYAKYIYIDKYKQIDNKCAYCNYGFEYRKYTNIYTNKKIKLKSKCGHKYHKYTMGKKVNDFQISLSGYNKRSQVPLDLIKEIINKLTK